MSSRARSKAMIRRVPVGFRGRSWYARYDLLLGAADALMIAISLVAVSLWRFGSDVWTPVVGTSYDYPLVAVVVGLVWWLVLDARRSRDRGIIGHGLEEYRRVMNATLFTFGAVAVASYIFQAQLSRAVFLVLLPLGATLLVVGRWLLRQVLHRRRAIGGAFTPTVVVGSGQEVLDVVRDLRNNPHAGYRPVAIAVPRADAGAAALTPGVVPAPGGDPLPTISLSSLERHVAEHRVGAVIVVPGLSRHRIRRLAWQLENSPVDMMFVPSMTDVAGPRLSVHQVQDLSLVRVDLPRYTGWSHYFKRAFDIVFSLVALVLLSPVLAVIAFLIRREDGGPVLFRQTRIGLGGEEFTIHKFRTMRVDAEARLAELRAQHAVDGPLFKLEDDPRITRIGRVLRTYSLDELPQFWTALRGHMSVVGPRPHLGSELAEYPDDGLRRLLIKPGITGLWQVSGRSDLSFEDAVRLDLRYVENWSLTGDIAIILKTIRAVLRPAGAY